MVLKKIEEKSFQDSNGRGYCHLSIKETEAGRRMLQLSQRGKDRSGVTVWNNVTFWSNHDFKGLSEAILNGGVLVSEQPFKEEVEVKKK